MTFPEVLDAVRVEGAMPRMQVVYPRPPAAPHPLAPPTPEFPTLNLGLDLDSTPLATEDQVQTEPAVQQLEVAEETRTKLDDEFDAGVDEAIREWKANAAERQAAYLAALAERPPLSYGPGSLLGTGRTPSNAASRQSQPSTPTSGGTFRAKAPKLLDFSDVFAREDDNEPVGPSNHTPPSIPIPSTATALTTEYFDAEHAGSFYDHDPEEEAVYPVTGGLLMALRDGAYWLGRREAKPTTRWRDRARGWFERFRRHNATAPAVGEIATRYA